MALTFEYEPRATRLGSPSSDVELVHLLDDPMTSPCRAIIRSSRKRALRLADLAEELWIQGD